MYLIKQLTAAAVAVTVASAGLSLGGQSTDHDDHHGDQGMYTIGLFGDMPYGAAGQIEYPRLLANINDARVRFSIFDGDLKAGGDGACTDDLYTRSRDWFNSLNSPVVVVPGDNDWTDCWGRYGPGTGGFDPLERLDHERAVFYPMSPSTLAEDVGACWRH